MTVVDEVWHTYRDGLQDTVAAVSAAALAAVVERIHAARQRAATIFICGNGGSAATASHMAVDLSKGTARSDQPPLRVIALTDNVPSLTAWANDTDYDRVFVEPLRALSRRGDVLVGISGSGNSPNVLAAAEWARANEVTVIGLAGDPQSRLCALSDLALAVAAPTIQHAEDVHLILQHAICLALRAMDTPAARPKAEAAG